MFGRPGREEIYRFEVPKSELIHFAGKLPEDFVIKKCLEYYENETEETICCFVLKDSSGNENQKNTCCFDMDLIFDGKVMTFKNNVISGTLNCNSDENSSQSLIPNQVVMLLYILIISFM